MDKPSLLCLQVRRAAKDWGQAAIVLAAACDADDVALTITTAPELLEEGTYLEFDTEIMRIGEDPDTNVPVSRGEFGTTAAAHDSGALGVVQPRFTNTAILAALNEAVHVMNAYAPREVTLTGATLLTTTDRYAEIALPAEPAGEGDYLDIARVDLADANGEYQAIHSWTQLGASPPSIRLEGNHPSARALRLHLTQAYGAMAWGDASAPVGMVDKYQPFLVKYAAGLLVAQDEVYASDFVNQSPAGTVDARGRMQAIGTQQQMAALAYLNALLPRTRRVTFGDSRNYRR